MNRMNKAENLLLEVDGLPGRTRVLKDWVPERPMPWYRRDLEELNRNPHYQKLSLEGIGLHTKLEDLCWVHGTIPSFPEGVADMLAADPVEIERVLPSVKRWFQVEGDSMQCPRVEKQRTIQDLKRLKCAEAGRKSFESKGNQRLLSRRRRVE